MRGGFRFAFRAAGLPGILLAAAVLLCRTGAAETAERISSSLFPAYDRPELWMEIDGQPPLPADGEKGRLLGGIVPHHDLAYPMILRFYRELACTPNPVRRVFLFSPDHFRRARRRGAVCSAEWETSQRTLRPDGAAVAALTESGILEVRNGLFVHEHGIAIHIPLIARFFPDADVVPIVLRADVPDLDLLRLRNVLMKLAGPGDLFILSMDLSHYKTPEAMAAEDVKTLDALLNLRPRALARADIDARRSAALLMSLFARQNAAEGRLLERSDSTAFLGRRIEAGTSYATVIYRVAFTEAGSDAIRR